MKNSNSNLAGLTFDDVFIRPGLASIRPDEVSLNSEVIRGCNRKLPVMASPMTSVFSPKLAIVMSAFGGVAPLPREMPLNEIGKTVSTLRQNPDTHVPVMATTSPFDEPRVNALLSNQDIDYVLLDTVAGHNEKVLALIERLPSWSVSRLVVGNIATVEAAEDYCKFPLAGLRVGLGSGSICTTSEVTGVGVPQLQAVQEVASVANAVGIPVISDGGIRETGDIAKALGAGADAVMMGRWFAQTTEAPGELREVDGTWFKEYAGAEYATIELTADYGNVPIDSEIKRLLAKNHRSEGVSGRVPHIGSVKLVMLHIERSLKASLAFVGARTLSDFRELAKFDKVSNASKVQSSHHSIDQVTHKNKLV